jgi:hypothetical protein
MLPMRSRTTTAAKLGDRWVEIKYATVRTALPRFRCTVPVAAFPPADRDTMVEAIFEHAAAGRHL